jgi:hypothetical protein
VLCSVAEKCLNVTTQSSNAVFIFTEHLDFMNIVDTSEVTFQQFRQMEHEYIGYQSLTDVPRALQYTEEPKSYQVGATLHNCRILL